MVRFKKISDLIEKRSPNDLFVTSGSCEEVIGMLEDIGVFVDCKIILVTRPTFQSFTYSEEVEDGTEDLKIRSKVYSVQHLILNEETKIENKKVYLYSVNVTPYIDDIITLTRFRRVYLRCVITEKDDTVRNYSGQLKL
jgi:hypothetical protein